MQEESQIVAGVIGGVVFMAIGVYGLWNYKNPSRRYVNWYVRFLERNPWTIIGLGLFILAVSLAMLITALVRLFGN